MPASLDALAKLPGLGRIVDIERRPAIDALAIVARRQHRQRAIPLGREDQDDIDVVAGTQRPKAIDFRRGKLAGRLLARWATSQQTARTSNRSESARSAGRCRDSQASPSPTMPTRSFMKRARGREMTGSTPQPAMAVTGIRESSIDPRLYRLTSPSW